MNATTEPQPADYPDGILDNSLDGLRADRSREDCEIKMALGEVTWRDILTSAVLAAYGSADLAELRTALVKVSDVAGAWVESIDRRVVS